NYCNDVDVEQTSNCGDKRIMKGTKIPTEWLPSVANKRYCEITTQSNNCYTRQVNGALPDIWTPDPANYWETQTITQTNTCGQTRQVQGTKINKIVRIYKMRATGQCCGYSKNWGYYPCGNCWFDINPNSKTFNSGINVTLGQESGPIPRDGFRTYNDIQVTCSDGQTFYVSGYEVSIGQTWNIPSHPQLRFNQEIRCPP
ncbi:MAG: hypothetical protein N2Z73_00490, partial [Endomicrobia bacterium]|nr:hypothetical protein [Endomicrobiia bacterium]